MSTASAFFCASSFAVCASFRVFVAASTVFWAASACFCASSTPCWACWRCCSAFCVVWAAASLFCVAWSTPCWACWTPGSAAMAWSTPCCAASACPCAASTSLCASSTPCFAWSRSCVAWSRARAVASAFSCACSTGSEAFLATEVPVSGAGVFSSASAGAAIVDIAAIEAIATAATLVPLAVSLVVSLLPVLLAVFLSVTGISHLSLRCGSSRTLFVLSVTGNSQQSIPRAGTGMRGPRGVRWCCAS